MDFGSALRGLRSGAKVRRQAWDAPLHMQRFVDDDGERLMLTNVRDPIMVDGDQRVRQIYEYAYPKEDILALDWELA
jgi:hypothetical protein